jgi:enterochelin esterase-like enzyme
MRQGAPQQIGLFGGGAANPAAPSPGPMVIPAPVTGLVPGPEPGSQVTPGSVSADHPWLAWRPSGVGTVQTINLPAPWTGGTSRTAQLQIYLPPGYTQGTRAYPVVYEVPWSVSYWAGAIQFPPLLDGLIDSGDIPPEIVVFISAHGGPYPDSECINSFDGREQFETYITDTVVPWADANLRTIPMPAARSLFGFSLGAFCTPNLLFKHPGLFQQAIAMSGYYTAAIRNSQTLNAWRPFGGNATLIAANSPMTEAALLAPSVRSQLFIALSGDPNEPFYGPQMRQFGTVLEHAGIPYAWLPTNLGHAWAAVRAELPAALEAVAEHQVQLHIFQ